MTTRILRGPVDSQMAIGILLISLLGVIMVFSTTIAHNVDTIHWQAGFAHAVQLSIAILTAFIIVKWVPIEFVRQTSRYWMAFAILLLVLTVVGLGLEINGSKRWLRLAGFNLQPVEFVKIAMTSYTALFLSQRPQRARDFSNGVLPLIAVLIVVATLLLLQPDFGSTVVIGLAVGAVLLIGGMRWSLVFLGIIVIGVVSALLVLISPYRMARVLNFQNPWDDPLGQGYQLSQALIALGRGEWTGVGLGASVQKLFYLPHADNDFILAIIGEELGFVGVAALVLAFGFVAVRVFSAANRAVDRKMVYHAFLMQGLIIITLLQAYIHIAVNLGLLPTKGINLPLVSRGGSSLLAMGIVVGLILRAQSEVDKGAKR